MFAPGPVTARKARTRCPSASRPARAPRGSTPRRRSRGCRGRRPRCRRSGGRSSGPGVQRPCSLQVRMAVPSALQSSALGVHSVRAGQVGRRRRRGRGRGGSGARPGRVDRRSRPWCPAPPSSALGRVARASPSSLRPVAVGIRFHASECGERGEAGPPATGDGVPFQNRPCKPKPRSSRPRSRTPPAGRLGQGRRAPERRHRAPRTSRRADGRLRAFRAFRAVQSRATLLGISSSRRSRPR